MNEATNTWTERLPFRMPVPSGMPPGRARALRVGAWTLLAAALVFPTIQFMHGTVKNLRDDEAYDRRREQRAAAMRAAAVADEVAAELAPVPGGPPLTLEGRMEVYESFAPAPPKAHKGAIGRWRKAVEDLWAGRNIYKLPPDARPEGQRRATESDRAQRAWIHPNMPLTVILLTPFAYLPVWAMALSFTLLKVLAIVGSFALMARVAAHRQLRIIDWVLGLGVLWSILFIIGDIQHGNTNGFVLACVVGHLWLYRTGRDVWAGAALALAICLKMTPALFVLYWLYQRNWRLLAATACWGLVMAAAVPAALLGPHRYVELAGTWLENLILPGLLKGAWYPVHINQSISGVMSRLFIEAGRPESNIYWNPDDNPYATQDQYGWIAVARLSPATVKWLIRLAQAAVVGLSMWAIGRRKLPRDDGRRALHYGLVALGILLLNQRTWDHHSGVLLIASVAAWQAIACGRMSTPRRAAALGLMIVAGLTVFLTGTELFGLAAKLSGRPDEVGEAWADQAKAYGPTFVHYVLVFAATVLLCRSLKGRDDPYAIERQPLRPGSR